MTSRIVLAIDVEMPIGVGVAVGDVAMLTVLRVDVNL